MSTMLSSPTSNLFELLQDEANPKRKANPNKQPAGKNQLSTADQQRKRQEEEEQKKMDAALASQHQEEAVAEGFVVAQTTSANKQNTRLSRLEWDAKKAKGESLENTKVEKENKKEPRNNNRNNQRDLDGPAENTNSQRNPKQFERQEQHTGGRGPKPGREFDKHSQSGVSRKPENKRGGGGKHNYGQITDTAGSGWNASDDQTTTDNTTTNTGSWGATEDNVEQTVGSWGSDAAKTEGAATATTTEGAATTEATGTDAKKPVDEDDGLKTLDDYAKERAAQAEALAKLVGNKQGRTEVDKKLDPSKFIDADKVDKKLQSHKQALPVKKAEPAKAAKKTFDFHELAQQQGNNAAAQQPRRNDRPPQPRNQSHKLNTNSTSAFPGLGEQPTQQQGEGYQRQQNKPPRQQGQGQQQQGERRQGGQGGQGQGQRQGNQGGGQQRGPRQGGQGGQGQGNRQQGQGQRGGNKGGSNPNWGTNAQDVQGNATWS